MGTVLGRIRYTEATVVTLDRAVWAQSLGQGTEFLMSTQALQLGKGKAITVYVVGMCVH